MVLDYLNYDVIVKIKTIKETPTEFPTISFLYDSIDEKPLENTLISCKFNGINCSENDFENLKLNSNYNHTFCKFNSGKNLTGQIIPKKVTKLGGKYNGFSLSVAIGATNFFQMIIHNNSFSPMQTSEDIIVLSPGFETSLKISRVFTYSLGEPYSSCKTDLTKENDFDSLLFNYIIRSNYSYQQKDCFDLCLSKYIMDNCNTTIKLSYSWLFSKNSTFQQCFKQKHDQFFEMNVNDFCSPYCPLECNTITYDYSLSFVSLTNVRTIRNMVHDGRTVVPDGYTSQDIVTFYVYYEDTTYSSISEIPKMELVDLVSSMGGLLGLFLGISFLSFGELIEMFLEVIFILFEK